MAKTIRAQHINELKNHFNRPATTFEQKVLTLRALFSLRGLGRPTRRWAATQLYWLQTDPQWISNDPAEQAKRQELLDQLHERNELAIKKCEARAANKLKEKPEKPKAPAAAPAATPASQQGEPTQWDNLI